MSNYKPKVTTIGGGTREFTDDEIKGRPMTIADTTDVAKAPVPDQIAETLAALRAAGVPEPDVLIVASGERVDDPEGE